MGTAAQQRLSITDVDRVLVSITLCHAFGIGSAVASAWLSGAAVVLPGASGIRGCGSPSQRAEATLAALASQRCSLLFADVHTLKALPDPGDKDLAALRGGVCKVGSGADFLEDVKEAKIGPSGELKPLQYAGVPLIALGKR
ncbi:cry [Symbiodinium sp. CCMP2456]|nr:cry [Symbiodinium sp. CCMP2456]